MKKVIAIFMIVFIVRPVFGQTWEYFEIGIYSKMGVVPIVSKNDTGMVRELFLDTVKHRAKTFNSVTEILNLLGQRGYELVYWGDRNGVLGSDVIYTFKRRTDWSQIRDKFQASPPNATRN